MDNLSSQHRGSSSLALTTGRRTRLTSGYNALALCSLEQHAVVPFGFRRQVSSCSSNLSQMLADCVDDLIAHDTAHVASTGMHNQIEGYSYILIEEDTVIL